MQYIFQSGVPRLDVAIWDKQTAFTSITTSYYPEDLVETGAKILQNNDSLKVN
jgi:hypothetical protein